MDDSRNHPFWFVQSSVLDWRIIRFAFPNHPLWFLESAIVDKSGCFGKTRRMIPGIILLGPERLVPQTRTDGSSNHPFLLLKSHPEG